MEKYRRIASALNLAEDAFLSREQVSELEVATRRRSFFTNLDDDQLVIARSYANEQVIKAANGRCELCEQSFPDGDTFLEAHHVIWLRDGGTPTVDNTVALCPNCHKRVHMYCDPSDVEKLMKAAKKHRQEN